MLGMTVPAEFDSSMKSTMMFKLMFLGLHVAKVYDNNSLIIIIHTELGTISLKFSTTSDNQAM